MSTSIEKTSRVALATLLCALSTTVLAQQRTYGFGTAATQVDLDRVFAILPDGRGLPPGSGSVEQGKTIYAQQCASCHGDALQGGIGDKLIGGRGTLVNNDPTKAPVKTIESYWPYATTIFDYVKRAMPFNAPDSLTDDQVYAVTAYILSEAKIVPADTTLDAKSLAAVRMPNRDGFIADPRPEKFPPVAKTPHQHMAIAPAK
ncbi:MAG TPA: cytochrome c [Casimicrobiaceae bacterium]|nr:cytochrome c [Casimicrobiaceae bacterium]